MFNSSDISGNLLGTKPFVPDIEVVSPPEDSVSALEFSPGTLKQNFLISGSWDNSVRCWQIDENGKSILKSKKMLGAPVLDCCWNNDGLKVFIGCCDNKIIQWDLNSDQISELMGHCAAVKTCHWITNDKYSCLMTGSWDKTVKFWDTRCSDSALIFNMPERVYCADVFYPKAAVVTANNDVSIFSLDNTPHAYKRQQSVLKAQPRAIAIFKNEIKDAEPKGYAIGGIEGRAAFQYFDGDTSSYKFKCHRNTSTDGGVDIYAINDIAIHPVHETMVTVGSDGIYNFWDRKRHTKLKTSASMEQPITKCAINSNGCMFAYAIGYDWSKGHEHNIGTKPKIFVSHCYESMKPKFL